MSFNAGDIALTVALLVPPVCLLCFMCCCESWLKRKASLLSWCLIAFVTAPSLVVFFILRKYPALVYIGFFLCVYPLMYCLWYYNNDEPRWKPPGGGKLLFAGALADNTHRWNILVDVIIIGFGLFAAAYVQDPVKVRGLYGISLIILTLPFWIPIVIYTFFGEGCLMDMLDEDNEDAKLPFLSPLRARLAANNGSATFSPHSVYADPAISLWSVFFKVLVPQTIAMVLYGLSFLFVDLKSTPWAIAYAILGAFFGPITLATLNIPQALEDADLLSPVVTVYDYDHFHSRSFASERAEERHRQLHAVYDKNGQKIVFDYRRLRKVIYLLSDLIGPVVLIFSLPIFLSKSEHQLDFVLNAMAMIFVLALDDIPADKRNTYTYIDPGHSDLENLDTWEHVASRDAETGSPTSARSEREHTNQDTTSPPLLPPLNPARDLESG